MKRFIIYLVAFLSVSFFSGCEKIKDDTAYFVGIWDVTYYTMWEWTNGIGDISTSEGSMEIIRISQNKVRISGGGRLHNATAVVNGHTLFIEEASNDRVTYSPSHHVMDGLFELKETYFERGDPGCFLTTIYIATKR